MESAESSHAPLTADHLIARRGLQAQDDPRS